MIDNVEGNGETPKNSEIEEKINSINDLNKLREDFYKIKCC